MRKKIPIRINILTLFLSLLLITAATIVTFTYSRNYKSIVEFSNQTIELASKTIFENVRCLFAGTKQLVESGSGWFLTAKDLSLERPELVSYMLHVIRYYPRVPFFYLANTEGDYIEAGDLRLSVQTHFFADPEKLLPKEAAYTMQFFKREGKEVAEKTVYYYNEDLEVIATEHLAEQKYDPRVRPWYLGAEETGALFWSDVYRYYDRPDLGFTISKPLFDLEGKLMGVIAADFAFKLLSEFFLSQRIGKTGRAYILDKEGKILIPEGASQEQQQQIADAMQVFAKDRDGYFMFRSEKARYLAHISPFPVAVRHNWKIAIVVPFADFFADSIRANHQVILLIIGISLLAMLVVIYFAKRLSDPIIALSKEIDRIQKLDLASETRIHSHIKEIHQMDDSVASMRQAFRSFVCYVPQEIVKQLLEKQEAIELGGEKKRLAIFFSDIASFTSIVESLSVEELMPLLEEYFEGMSKIILESKGNIDKYIGDSIMAFWGAPLEVEDQTGRCCLAALRCREFVAALNEKRRKEQKPEFLTRIGIDGGTVVVGNIGTHERMNYTAIGDAVLFASHLEQLNKVYQTTILVSESVRKEVGERFLFRPIETQVYELVAEKGQEELCRRFTEGYEAFSRGDRQRAKELFGALHRDFPEDEPTKVYLDRLKGT